MTIELIERDIGHNSLGGTREEMVFRVTSDEFDDELTDATLRHRFARPIAKHHLRRLIKDETSVNPGHLTSITHLGDALEFTYHRPMFDEVDVPPHSHEVEIDTSIAFTSELPDDIKSMAQSTELHKKLYSVRNANIDFLGQEMEHHLEYCPGCTEPFLDILDGVIKGDEGELYCSVECLNEVYVDG